MQELTEEDNQVMGVIKPTVGKTSVLHAAILQGIVRCENISNPALIERKTFTVHVRKLPVADGRGWVVRIIDKTRVFDRQKEISYEQVSH